MTYQEFAEKNLPYLCKDLVFLSENGVLPRYSLFNDLRKLVCDSGIPKESCQAVAESVIKNLAFKSLSKQCVRF